MDYYKLSSDFLKTMRGDVPQRELSAALGYSYNKIGKLESGANQIKWDEFIKIAEKCNYPILNNLNSFFYHFEGEHISIEFYNYLTNIYSLGTTSSVQLKSLVSKWKKGNQNPDLAEILQIIDSRPSMLAGFFNVFKVGRYLPQLAEELQLLDTKVNLLSREPIIGYINAALYIEEYKNLEIHNDEILAQHSSCSIAKLNEILKLNKELNFFPFDGKKYLPSDIDFGLSGLKNKGVRNFNKFTYEKSASLYSVDPDIVCRDYIYTASMGSSRVTALSVDASEKIALLISKFHSEVGQIIDEDLLPKENVQIISVASIATTYEMRKELH